MDFELLPQLTIIFSIVGLLFIVGRNFSKVKEAAREEIFLEESAKEKEEKEKFLYLYKRGVRRINKENYQKKMADFWLWLEKFLRKVRIKIMKLDGKMVAMLENLRKKNVKSIEELKGMAEQAEKNVRRSKEAEGLSSFLSSKGVHRKSRKAAEEALVAERKKTTDANTYDRSSTFMPKTEDPVVVEETYIEVDEQILSSPETSSAAEPLIKEDDRTAQSEYVEDVEIVTIVREGATRILSEETVENGVPEEENAVAEDLAVQTEAENMEEPYETVAAEEIKKDTDAVVESAEEEKVRTKKEQECIELLMQNPADIKAYWRLGLIYSKRRNYEDALACFSQIVKIDPTYTKAKQKVIELMEKMRKKGR